MTENFRSSNLSYPHIAIPYGTQWITAEDRDVVIEALTSQWLTQGPRVDAFERAFSNYCGSLHATAVSNGTAALHLSYLAAGLGPGDTLWTSPNTFVSCANAALLCGAKVDFVDIDPETRNLSVDQLRIKLQKAKKENTLPKILVPVHFAGHPCDMEPIWELCRALGIIVIEDATHAIGGFYKEKKIGGCQFGDMAVFSFHAVKTMTTGEGGMITTNNTTWNWKLNRLRTHGITREPHEFVNPELSRDENLAGTYPWYYEQQDLGLNYRITDIQCALGLSQLQRLDKMVSKRRHRVEQYNRMLNNLPLKLQFEANYAFSAWHLYVIEIDGKRTDKKRRDLFDSLRQAGIGVNVHYIPVHRQPYYQRLGFQKGDFPNAEAYYEQALTLPLHPKMTDDEFQYVIGHVRKNFSR